MKNDCIFRLIQDLTYSTTLLSGRLRLNAPARAGAGLHSLSFLIPEPRNAYHLEPDVPRQDWWAGKNNALLAAGRFSSRRVWWGDSLRGSVRGAFRLEPAGRLCFQHHASARCADQRMCFSGFREVIAAFRCAPSVLGRQMSPNGGAHSMVFICLIGMRKDLLTHTFPRAIKV